MEQLSCIVHFSINDSKYTRIKTISDINKEKIYAAKALKQELGGANHHKEQCESVPDEIDYGKTGIYLEPCYKKFVRILSDKQSLKDQPGCSNDVPSNQTRPKRGKSLDSTDARGVYPKECNFCKKYRIKRHQKHYYPTTISTLQHNTFNTFQQAVSTIKQAAEANEDQSLYFEIKDLDLIAKEFKYHNSCYKEYTRKEKVSLSTVAEGDERESGDFKAVVKCIAEKVLQENQAVSMK
eukprot:gene19309-21233_t